MTLRPDPLVPAALTALKLTAGGPSTCKRVETIYGYTDLKCCAYILNLREGQSKKLANKTLQRQAVGHQGMVFLVFFSFFLMPK